MIAARSIAPQSRKADGMLSKRAKGLLRAFSTSWSGKISFTSPESDFKSSHLVDGRHPHHDMHTLAMANSSPEWSSSVSFSAPFADFSSQPLHPDDDQVQEQVLNNGGSSSWSGVYSFTSPEADFTADPHAPLREWLEEHRNWSNELSFASPESDFKAAWVGDQVNEAHQDDAHRTAIARHPALHVPMVAPESAVGHVHAHQLMEEYHLEQLAPLPKTLQEALADPRPIVVTSASAPFHIVDVNDAWVGLCGFSKEEARGCSLNLIQGHETEQERLDKMMSSLLDGDEASVTVTNYTKDGRKFRNQLHTGPLREEAGSSTPSLFVGVLNEVPSERVGSWV